METILLLVAAEEDGGLGKPALEAATAARELAARLEGAKLLAGIFGAQAGRAGAALAGAGFGEALLVEHESLARARFATDAAACQALVAASGASLVLAPATSRLQRVLAAVSARCRGAVDTHATALGAESGAVHATRWFYRQRMVGRVSRERRPWFLSLEPGVFAPHAASGDLVSRPVPAPLPESRTRVEGLRSPSSGAQTIRPDAPLLFVAGAGWCKKQADGLAHVSEAERLILGFLGKSGASLGGSKSVVDQKGEGGALSFLTHLNQVGQTGSTPRHAKGLATCCHGEEPHTVGWRFVSGRRAVNLDANCGWAQGKADVLYVADAFKVMARVNELLAG